MNRKKKEKKWSFLKWMREKRCRRLSRSTDHQHSSWASVLLTASLLPLEPILKRNQPLCLACKCLTVNQHHKTHSGSWLDALSLAGPLHFTSPSSLPPQLPPLLFPQLLCGGGCWAYATLPLPFFFFQYAPQLHDSHQSAADAMATGPLGSVRQAQREYAGALRGLPANRAALTSPTPRQRLGSKDSYCPHTHTHTSLTSSINTKRTNIKLKGNHKMSGRTNRAETLKAPRHSSTLPRLTFHWSFICLMFSMQRKWLQSN